MKNMALLREPNQRKLLFNAGFSWLFDRRPADRTADGHECDWNGRRNGSFRFARRSVRTTGDIKTLLIFSIASGLSAMATGFIFLCALRFIAGFGLGGELPVTSTLVSESVPVKERGRAEVCCLKAFGQAAGS
ncbi:hypothetical protein ASG81_20895 [Paenibacillus sp. Soil522]|nr:hypothetical protein ASG81_20895 [Paenibacillus sp. Soil522]